MKISIAQINYHIGNFRKNSELICNAINDAKKEGSELIIFSELSVSGYPPLDLLDHVDFVNRCNQAVIEIAEECRGITAIVGSPTINSRKEGKKLFNSALVLSEGKIIHQANKTLLPTYDIFDEYRYFEPEKSFSLFEFMGKKIALTICEDLWDEQPFDNAFEKVRLYTVSPMDELAKLGPDLVINIAASPFSYSKIVTRRNIFTDKAKKYGIPVLTVNQIGANTELIFDGASVVVNNKGGVIDQLPAFEECTRSYSLDEILTDESELQELTPDIPALISKALVVGIKDYFSKSGFRRAVIGLSGGIDSAVCCCLASEALGPDHVTALLLPSRYSSEHSVSDAIDLCNNLGISYRVISIEKPFSAFEEILSPVFDNLSADVTEENIQARVRAVILMAYSNKLGHILLNTSNKSEAAVGYGTLYGDMAGGLSVIGDVYKSDIYRLAGYINRNGIVIPQNIISKPPSAELKYNQLDTDSLPEYRILDLILYNYIELQKSPGEIVEEGFHKGLVLKIVKMINWNEYKRYQAPPILRISSKAFGAGRRMPLVAVF